MKRRFLRACGSDRVLPLPGGTRLMARVRGVCAAHAILTEPNEILTMLETFEAPGGGEQLCMPF